MLHNNDDTNAISVVNFLAFKYSLLYFSLSLPVLYLYCHIICRKSDIPLAKFRQAPCKSLDTNTYQKTFKLWDVIQLRIQNSDLRKTSNSDRKSSLIKFRVFPLTIITRPIVSVDNYSCIYELQNCMCESPGFTVNLVF